MPTDDFDDDADPDDFDGEASALDALDAAENRSPHLEAAAQDGFLTLMFTAANPRQTVSVTSLVGGRVHQVDLSPAVVEMTEAELAREIMAIAALASRQGKAGAHALIAAALGRSGLDSAAVRGHLELEIGLPSPDTVRAERAGFFAARYAEDRE